MRKCQMLGCENEGTIEMDMGVSNWKEPWYFCSQCYNIQKLQFNDCKHLIEKYRKNASKAKTTR
jgi:hypothetical protein